MSDQDATTPRVFLARHGPYLPAPSHSHFIPTYILTRANCAGETEWTINGRYTGVTELDLTANGVQQVLGSGKRLVGPGKLIDPARITRVFVSPRKRAQTTFGLLFGQGDECMINSNRVTITEEIAEWGYGEYEGLLTPEIVARRAANGMDKEKPWDIWRDGCEGGE